MHLSVSRILLAVLLAATAHSAYAIPIPTHGAVVHFDLNPGGAFDIFPAFPGVPAAPAPVVGGPCGVFATGEFCDFVDALVSPNEPFHWESQIMNVNPVPVAFNVGFFFPGGPILGRLGLAPGATFYIDIHVNDVPEVGPWRWAGFSTLPFALGMDTSVTEDPRVPNVIVCDDGCTFDPNSTVIPDVRYDYNQVPEPATALLMGVALAGLSALLRRRTSRR